MENSIIDKQLKGVTLRIVSSIVIGVASIVATVMGSYYSLKDGLKDIERVNEIQDLRIDGLKRDAELQALQIRELSIRITETEKRLVALENSKQKR